MSLFRGLINLVVKVCIFSGGLNLFRVLGLNLFRALVWGLNLFRGLGFEFIVGSGLSFLGV